MIVRVRFNVNVGPYVRDQIYDIEADDVVRRLVGAKLCDIVPFPPRGTVPEEGED